MRATLPLPGGARTRVGRALPRAHSSPALRDGREATPQALPATAERLADCLWIALCGIAIALLLRPFQDTPFVDDWTYAWSVDHLLAGDGLRVLDWSSNLNFAQVLWGALFCLPLGFSFVALRLSTWVAALLALCALDLLLRELGVGRRDALLGVALLGLNPIFFMLSATFMTDVPFLAASLWATLAIVLAITRHSDRWLIGFALFAAIASAVRVVAVVLPVAAVLALLLHAGSWGRQVTRIVVAAAPLVFFALLVLWSAARMVHVVDMGEIAGSPDFRKQYLLSGLLRLPTFSLQAVLCAASSLGVALLPLAAGLREWRSVRRALPFVGLLLALVAIAAFAGIEWPSALSPTFTWTYGELGATESLVAGKAMHSAPAPIVTGVTLIGLMATALVLGSLRRRLRAPESFIAWSLAGQLGLLAILWLFYDRYLLALLPLLIALFLGARPALNRARVAVLVAGLALLSVVGVRDHLAYNEALWRGVTRLREDGIADADIDGGYVVDGWLQFAQPEHAPRDAANRPFFPWLTAPGGLLPYQIANLPLPDWRVLDEIPYRRWLGRSGAIYVLARAG